MATKSVDVSYFDPRLFRRIAHLNLAGRLAHQRRYIAGGGYGDVFMGRYISKSRGYEVKVAIKRLRFHMDDAVKRVSMYPTILQCFFRL